MVVYNKYLSNPLDIMKTPRPVKIGWTGELNFFAVE